MNMKNKKTAFITQTAIIAALYAALTWIFAPISFWAVQFRVSEALCILPYFTPAAIPGVTIGCVLGNLITGAPIWDVIFGSLATLIGAVGSYLLRKKKWLVPIPPIVSNVIIIPFVLKFAYKLDDAIPFMMLTVGIGEILAIYLLGMILLIALEKTKTSLFKKKQ
ncbi:MAG: QueT transporter family protein [Clostridia bacterium]|nr:QueT transporter family protein [Clostridia bacterium]